jgi:L-serine dehydratase
MIDYVSIQELIDKAQLTGRKISALVLEDQSEANGRSEKELFDEMAYKLKIMQEAAREGAQRISLSASGLSGGDAFRLSKAFDNGKTIGGSTIAKVMIKALSTAEVNAGMGRIVAAPTAGSCGIIPAALLTVMEEQAIPEEKIVMGLFTAAGIGMVIARNASISGAEGGCQAECGSASAMAAGALVETMGGNPGMVGNACAFALKNVLGLTCDPVAGLVEVPCIKRNASGAVNAIVAANMALAEIESVIPVDEVILAMKSIGALMSSTLKETSEGGLASTPTGCRLKNKIFGTA